MSAQIKKHGSSKRVNPVRLFLTPLIVVIVLSLSWLIYRSMLTPTGINEVASKIKIDSNGCYYKQVQCVTAPCEPILVCPTQTSTGQVCTQEAGTCIGLDGSCVTFTDGCEKSRLCSPKQLATGDRGSCGFTKPTPKPNPSCLACPMVSRPPEGWCNGGKIITKGVDACGCELGGECIMPPSPSVVANPALLTTFYATTTCGVAHFSSYQYTCSNGQKFSENSQCISLTSAMASARVKCRSSL